MIRKCENLIKISMTLNVNSNGVQMQRMQRLETKFIIVRTPPIAI